MKTISIVEEKPLVVLVYEQSFLRMWMERALSRWYRVCIFSTTEDALAFVHSTKKLDVLITDLNLRRSVLGGCNIAREAHQVFPQCHIFVFNDHSENDHRMIILKEINKVKFLINPFGAFFLVSRIKNVLKEKKAI